jgi:hypothetical protein
VGMLIEHNRKVTPYAIPIIDGDIRLPWNIPLMHGYHTKKWWSALR